MSSDLIIDKEYRAWLSDIKLKVRNVQIKAALKVQTELLNFYWDLGADIVTKQTHARWGDGLIEQLSTDLMAEFPDIKGFSRSNLMYIEVIAKVEINLNLQFPRVMKHGNDPNPISISNGGRQQSKINCINS